jgi:preprotein translocase subunit YajC
LHGSVVGLDEKRDVAVLKIADNVKVEVDRGSISRVKSPGS